MFVSSLKCVFILFEDFYHSNYQDNIIYEGIVGEIRGLLNFVLACLDRCLAKQTRG